MSEVSNSLHPSGDFDENPDNEVQKNCLALEISLSEFDGSSACIRPQDSIKEPKAIVSDEDDSRAFFVQQLRGKRTASSTRKQATSTTTTASRKSQQKGSFYERWSSSIR
jgi:hypothetical protein